jgi:acyl-coenzyme A thioesterase PaaI-like protein
VGDQPGDDAAAIRLGAAIRELMDAAVLTGCDDEVLEAVATQVTAAAARLSEQQRDTMPWPDDDSMRRGDRPFSPVIGEANPLAPPMTVQVLPDCSVVAELTMRPIHEGPPGALHGGWVAMLLDQLLGHANAAAGVGAFTGSLTVRYRRPTPYGVPLLVRARTDSVDGRRVHASGEIVADGEVTAEATGLFVQPSAARVAELNESTGERTAAS